jgi:sugar/nucleoside kinase (ribokinase family)
VILAVGEALMELRRATPDGALTRPGSWDGPFCSGAPAIFASVAARLGAPVALAAAVGEDRFGDALAERLAGDGVRTDALVRVPGRATAVAFVAYAASGARDFWFSVPDSAAADLPVGAVAPLWPGADWLHVSGSTVAFGGAMAEAVEASAAAVLRGGGRLSVDPNLRPDARPEARERTARLARAAHVLFPSEGELAALGLDPAELVAEGALVCETRGAAGVLVRSAGAEPVGLPAPAAQARDPTGAGDTFAAAFVAAVREGAEPVAAAQRACAVAAASVAVLGAMEAPVEIGVGSPRG